VTATNEQREHLGRLAGELSKWQFTARLEGRGSDQYLIVENPDHRDLNERVHCYPAEDRTWCFWWPWRQPIGSVDDVETVVGKIMAVLRTVEGGA
jgi:hypothetical protein